MPLYSPSRIKSTLLIKTSVFCYFPNSKHQTKTEINLTLQQVFWLPITNYATESPISMAVAVPVHSDIQVSQHLYANIPWCLICRSIYFLHHYWVNFWKIPGIGNCTVLCKRAWGSIPLQPPSWFSLIPAKVPLACGHHVNLVIMVVGPETGINPRHNVAIILVYYQPKPDLNCWPRSERLCILLPIS